MFKKGLFVLFVLAATFPVFAHGKGDIDERDVAQMDSWQEEFDIDKKKVVISNPIKNTGMFKTRVKLHPQVSADINVEVVTGA